MTCTKCGVNRDDPTRDFYPLWSEDHCVFAQRTVFRWFTTTTTHAPLCPSCASAQLAERSSHSHTRSGRIVRAEADLGSAHIARASGH